MKEKDSRLIVDGNAVYEIDGECLRKRKKEPEKRRRKEKKQGK